MPEIGMFSIADYALPTEVAEQVADEVRYYIGSAARASEEIQALRAELARERETNEAFRFALSVYGWTDRSKD
jgi:hypothetical protein